MRGHVCDIEKIIKFPKKNKLKVIEDCSQCLEEKLMEKESVVLETYQHFFQFNN